MSTDERPDSLAAQAASWVPPWERQQPPDRAYQAAAMAEASAAEPADGEADGVPPELSPLPGEADAEPAVDAPVDVPDEDSSDPTDVGVVPEVPLPTPVEDATEQALDEDPGAFVDAPLTDGDDAGDVFDAAADDDVELDVPFTDETPSGCAVAAPEADEPDADQDLPLADETPSGGAVAAPDADADQDLPLAEESPDGGYGVAPEADEPDTDDSFGARAAFAAGADDAEVVLADAPAAQRAQPRSTVPTQGRGSQGPPVAVGEEDARTNESDLPALDDRELRAALEAILLVVDEPVAEMQLAQIVEQPTERVAAMLEDISARYTAAGHGFDLRRAAGGWRLYTRPEYAPYVERFVLDGQSVRLTQAALETLAVVAYKQPVTRSRISAIRGVNCDGVMRTLVTRGLIEECGTEGETGAYLYRTTPLFLEKLGLNSVDQLPPLAPFLPDDVEEVLDASG